MPATFKRQHSVVKIWQLIGGPLAAGAPSHGTTSTMDNPALTGANWDRGVAKGPCPQPIVDQVEFIWEKNWFCWDEGLALFSKVFCGLPPSAQVLRATTKKVVKF